MKRRFVVLIDSANQAQENAFIDFIKVEGFGYWHWLNNSWLLTSHNSQHTAKFIGDKMQTIFPNVNHMVLRFDDDGMKYWGGFGPAEKDRDMFKWMHENWSKD